MPTPINNLMNQVDWSQGPIAVNGWNFNYTDLNAGAGGAYIYTGYQLGTANPVTSMTYIATKVALSEPPSGWEHWTGIDLNTGAGGQYVYMLWNTNEAGKAPITAIDYVATQSNTPPSVSHFTECGIDLNSGAGGLYIWPYYSTTVASSSLEKTRAEVKKAA